MRASLAIALLAALSCNDARVSVTGASRSISVDTNHGDIKVRVDCPHQITREVVVPVLIPVPMPYAALAEKATP